MLAGAVQLTLSEPLAAVAATAVGAPGTVRGVTELDAAELLPVPSPLRAVTVKVYAVPFVSGDTKSTPEELKTTIFTHYTVLRKKQ